MNLSHRKTVSSRGTLSHKVMSRAPEQLPVRSSAKAIQVEAIELRNPPHDT
jgi:hypothetical protein